MHLVHLAGCCVVSDRSTNVARVCVSTACPVERDMRCAARVCSVLALDTRDRHSCPLQ